MNILKETANNINIIIPGRSDLNLTRLYDKDFTKIFNLSKIHITYAKYEHADDDFDELKKSIGGGNKKNKKNGIINKISKYVQRFFPKSNKIKQLHLLNYLKSENPGEDVIIYMPKQNNEDFITLNELKSETKNYEYLCFENTNITYDILLNLVHDIEIVLDYMNTINLSLKLIDINNVYRIQNRYVLLDGANLVLIGENANENLMNKRKLISDFIKILLNRNELLLLEIQGLTDLIDYIQY